MRNLDNITDGSFGYKEKEEYHVLHEYDRRYGLRSCSLESLESFEKNVSDDIYKYAYNSLCEVSQKINKCKENVQYEIHQIEIDPGLIYFLLSMLGLDGLL